MSSVDGERIAPVTYLFGSATAPAPATTDTHDTIRPPETAGGAPLERPASGPKFVDLSEPEPTQPNRTEPNLAEPNLTEPNRTEPNLTGAGAADTVPAPDRPRASSKAAGSFDRISNVSMYALARRGMSSVEMHDYLLGREFEQSAVEVEVGRLERVDLLDDHALAQTLIRTLQSRKGFGRSALTAELRRRKLDPVSIESAMAELDDDDELERATSIAIKRAGQLRSLDAATAKRRLGDFLMRRGYSGSVVSQAVQQALAPSGPSFR